MKSEPIPETVRAGIDARLRQVEQTEGVRILLAVESGSRAWGFASPDSDFDVRFIYCHPTEWYLSIDMEDHRDVLEYGIVDEIDMNGWDLRKALRLLRRSNPNVVEWLLSPIRYLAPNRFDEDMLAILPAVYSPHRGMHHYWSMARTNFEANLRRDTISLKKYFYTLRALLAVRWIETYGEPPPIEFDRLLAMISGQEELLAEIGRLLDAKRLSPERGLAAPIHSVNHFIEAELQRLADSRLPEANTRVETGALNALFRSTLARVWNG